MISNLVGFDDAPFERGTGRMVPIVGAVYAGDRLDGVLTGEVTEDGNDANSQLARLLGDSPFDAHVQAIMIQGLTLGGFNVVDLPALAEQLARPVLAVVRRRPDLDAVREALLKRVPGGEAKWERVERAGPVHSAGPVHFQCAGMDADDAREIIGRFTRHGHMPEPLRTAHLIAGALVDGHSRGRV